MKKNTFSDDNNFAQMMEQSFQRKYNFSIGDQVEGTVILIDRENIFVDISGKNEAILSRQEFLDKEENLMIKEGDRITAYISSINRGEIMLTTRIGKVEANKELMLLAYQNGIPVEGIVSEIGSGGYTVMVSRIRCFCPFSQMDLYNVKEPEKFLNTMQSFRVVSYENRGQNIVLSRRALLEEAQAKTENDFRAQYAIGDTIEGTVKSIHDFGLIVDMGGIDALVPKSEISYSRNPDMNAYPVGKKIFGKILSLDWAKKKYSLSIKQLSPAPWDNIHRYQIGAVVSGRITKIIPAGAFVEIEPGVEGLIHISKMSLTKKIRRPEDAVSIGQSVQVRIANIDEKNQKMSLELLTGETDPWLDYSIEIKQQIHSGVVEMAKGNGIHIRLSNGMLGYAHYNELLSGAGQDLMRAYPAGKTVQVAITEIDAQNRKLFVSEKKALSQKEQNEFESYRQEEASAHNSSLGNLFKSQFEKIKNNLN